MKQSIAICICLSFLISISLNPLIGGTNNPNEPRAIFQIFDINDLQDMQNHLTDDCVLMNDIDASVTSNWNWNNTLSLFEGFQPIGSVSSDFTGSLDGNNLTVTGLYINRPNTNYSGLLGYVGIGGVVKNLRLVDKNITGYNKIGGLVGYNDGTVSNSYGTGFVTGTGSYVGGFIGQNQGSIANCSAAVNTTGSGSVGGFVGYNAGTVSNSYVTGMVTGTGSYVGGFTGRNLGSIANCSAVGIIAGNTYVGGLIGLNSGSVNWSYAMVNTTGNLLVGGLLGIYSGTLSNSYYNIDSVLINGGHHITIGGLFDAQYQDWLSNNLTLDIADYSASLIPSGEYYNINTLQGLRDLLGFASIQGYKFRLTANIDLSTASGFFIPRFAGVFNGDNYTISNLHIDLPFVSHLGMFGYVTQSGIINNASIVNTSTNAYYYVGGLIGVNRGSVTGCHVTGTIYGSRYVGGLIGINRGPVTACQASGNISGSWYIGGLIGENRGPVTACQATGIISGSWYVGGLEGQNVGGTVSECFAMGTISGFTRVGGLIGGHSGLVTKSYATGNSTGDPAGGLVGWNGGTITECYATGNTSGSGHTGGLVGYNRGTISCSYALGNTSGLNYVGGLMGDNYEGNAFNCYAMGNVIRNIHWDTIIGGFVGRNKQGRINNCYSTGKVIYENATNPTNKGFAGSVVTYGYEMKGNYWDIETSLQTATAGEAIGENTTQMMTQSTFTNASWNFTSIWHMAEGVTYPMLQWQTLPPGNGTIGAPYLIFNVWDLQNMSLDIIAHYALVNDIDASFTLGWNGGEGFVPIGNWSNRFNGSLDGRKHIISGLCINRSDIDYQGLFRYIDMGGVVKNLGLVENDVTGARYVGGLVGINNGSINNCYVTGKVGGNSSTGGLVGENEGTINNCYTTDNTTRISTSSNIDFGGLVGRNNQGKIFNSYSIGRVIYEGTTNPTDKGFAGSVVTSGNYEMSGNFWDIETSMQTTTAGNATGKNTMQMMNKTTFSSVGWDFINIWHMIDGGTYPVFQWQALQIGNGTIGNPYLIFNAWDLQDMNLDLGAHYALANDINASDTKNWHGGYGFIPVGTNSNVFTGSLDGRNHTITELKISRWSLFIGLFGCIGPDSVVKNVHLVDCLIYGCDYVGGLIGFNYGMVFNSSASKIANGNNYIGGLIGYNVGSISYCYSTGNVNGNQRVGGFVGWNAGSISECYTTGYVYAGYYFGGFAGQNGGGSLENCYATGGVTQAGGSSNKCFGGFVGISNGGNIINCYSVGRVTANGPPRTDKGFAGSVSGTVETGDFWDIETSLQTSTAGNAIGKTTAQMKTKSTFTNAGWDFITIWWMIEGTTYPLLLPYTPIINHIIVSPNPITMAPGGTQQFVATAYDVYYNYMPGVTFTWTTNVGTINTTGHYTAQPMPGTGTVTATNGTISGNASIIISVGIDHIEVTPNPATLIAGETQQFNALAYDIYGNEVPGVTFTWTTNVGLINQTGLFTAQNTSGLGIVEASAPSSMPGYADVTVVGQIFNLDLDIGWNLISIPLEQANDSIDLVLNSIDGKWDCIQTYDPLSPEPWKTSNIYRPKQLNEIATMDRTMAFWINITEPNVTLTVSGYIPTSTSIPLHTGWNLVGYPTLTEMIVADALWGTGVDKVEVFDPAEPYRIREVGATYVMKPGEGYWVHVPSDTVWVVDW